MNNIDQAKSKGLQIHDSAVGDNSSTNPILPGNCLCAKIMVPAIACNDVYKLR